MSWKIGLNVAAVQRQLGLAEPVIGHLTSATRLDDGAALPTEALDLRVEPEVALHMGAGGTVAGFGAAVELVDVGEPPPDVEAIVAANVFHRGFVLGPVRRELPDAVTAEVRVNGQRRAGGDAPDSFADVVELVRRLLGEAGEELCEGDVIIAGSLTAPQPVGAGDLVAVSLSGLGELSLSSGA